MTVEIEIDESVISPCYRHLRESEADIDLIWGGRDSGKSHYTAQELVLDCLESDYFRCVLVKKTFESIKDSQWQTIKDIVEEWGLSDYFEFYTSPLEIRCVNGNKFIARGCDKPGKLKSIKDPSHVWIEEANQLSEEEYIVLSTTLRTSHGRVKEKITFNPECECHYEEFWMVKKWPLLANCESGSDTISVKLAGGEIATLTYTSTHTTYLDNPYCTNDRKAKIEGLLLTNPFFYDVFALGKWGRKENDSPAAYAFNRDKHLRPTVWKPYELTIVSCDFNRNPMCWTVFQIVDNKVFGIECIKEKNTGTPFMCDYLLTKYPGAMFMVTGDASGANTNTVSNDAISNYTIIRAKLNLANSQLKVPAKNPSIKHNLTLSNLVLSQIECSFDPVNCKHLIYDFENVRRLPDGTIDKSDRNNPAKQADAFDTWRYFCNTFFAHLLKLVE